ncbi:carbonic anhydrase [Salinicola rhizosphaerae]|uniref:Carbonic anhydrase n=1 Tax=Salinicola rhizosphaerae TaxID=1443141 RepID=A0ABQ3DXE6_9GAMM|nr:carbonic anhydrase [Salinicola rhizosphaerae]GHB19417.1 carbonic anhydrase [Salinicola rhizosphaerae]
MKFFDRLLLENRAWAAGMKTADPEIFERLHEGQAPSALWIGCCDSRVPAEQICNAKPGELFIHRNIANLVHEDDPNAASVLEYAIQALKVDHIIVCGHRGCGGIQAAVTGGDALAALPNVDRHLDQVKQLVAERGAELERFTRLGDKVDHIVELNVIAQVERLAGMPVVQESWEARRAPTLHGWVYDLATGELDDVYRQDPGGEAGEWAESGWRRRLAG